MSSQLPLSTRGSKGYVIAIIAGIASAVVFGVALAKAETMLIFLAYFSALPLFLAGLGAGTVAGALATFTGYIVLLLGQSSNVSFVYLVAFGLPTATIIALSLRHKLGLNGHLYWYPEGFILAGISLFPCLIFLIAVVMSWNQKGGLQGLTLATLNIALIPYKQNAPADVLAQMNSFIQQLAEFLPCAMAFSWITIIILSISAAQRFLQQRKWNIRTIDYLGIHLPHWLIYILIATGIVAVLAPAPFGYVGLNLFSILSIPFFCVGLAVVHVWAATTKSPGLLLTMFYIFLSCMFWPVIFVALAGALDQWLNFRRRFVSVLNQKN